MGLHQEITMTDLIEELSSKARKLPAADRVRLADELLATVHKTEDEVEMAWEVQYYAKISPQIGERFATVIEQALAIATEFPDIGSPYKYGSRRVFPKRF
jgi:hypothetical protein